MDWDGSKKSLEFFVDQLCPHDKVSIVIYAGSAGVAVEPTSGSNKAKILVAINQFEAGGSTTDH